MSATTALRPHAPLTALDAANVLWTGGFWGDELERTRTVTVPGMWDSLSDPAVSPGWRNFLIAAGDAEGQHEGPPILDGDLYKWLEAAISLLETSPDAALEASTTTSPRRSPPSNEKTVTSTRRRASPNATMSRPMPSPTGSTSRRTTSATSSPPACATTGDRRNGAAGRRRTCRGIP